MGLKLYDGTDWIKVGDVDTGGNKFSTEGTGGWVPVGKVIETTGANEIEFDDTTYPELFDGTYELIKFTWNLERALQVQRGLSSG